MLADKYLSGRSILLSASCPALETIIHAIATHWSKWGLNFGREESGKHAEEDKHTSVAYELCSYETVAALVTQSHNCLKAALITRPHVPVNAGGG